MQIRGAPILKSPDVAQEVGEEWNGDLVSCASARCRRRAEEKESGARQMMGSVKSTSAITVSPDHGERIP